jgi:hypothetical protein
LKRRVESTWVATNDVKHLEENDHKKKLQKTQDFFKLKQHHGTSDDHELLEE